MKSLLLTVCLAACLAASAAPARDGKAGEGKARPDLSGTWVLDRPKSDFGVFWDRPLARTDATLVVSHREPELKMTRTLRLDGREETKEFAYYTDGRGETNVSTMAGAAAGTRTGWERDAVVARGKLSRPGKEGRVEVEVTESWQLSGGGKTLTHRATVKGEFGEEGIKLVYRRAD